MSVDQLPDRLNLSSFVGDDFDLIVEFFDEDDVAYPILATDLEASIHRSTPVPFVITQVSASSVRLTVADSAIGDVVRNDRWSLRYLPSDRAWFAGNFNVTADVVTGTSSSGDVVTATIGDATVHAVLTVAGAIGPQGIQGIQGIQGLQGLPGVDGETGVTVQEDGVTIRVGAQTLNFVGATVTEAGGVVTITVAGGGYTFIEDTGNPGLYFFSGPLEDPGDPGLYLFTGLSEDTLGSGLYLMGA